jgi:cytochrome c oxidase subunit III
MRRRPGPAAGGPATLAMRLLILSLAVLFVAALVGYVLTRLRLDVAGAVTVPRLLWFSTAALLAAGGLLELAWRALRYGRREAALVRLRLAGSAAVVFLVLQVPALWQLLVAHPAATDAGNPLLGFVFFLVLLHALHVLAGLVAMGVQIYRTWARPLLLDEHGPALRLLGRYWHFLDLVWVVMFAVFLLV